MSISGNDSLSLNFKGAERIFSNFANTDAVDIAEGDDIINMENGKNGATMTSFNEQGRKGSMTLRLLLGSADHKFLVSQRSEFLRDNVTFGYIKGNYTKRIGDGDGNVSFEEYSLEAGIFTKGYTAIKTNVDGDVEQNVAVWTIMFGRINQAVG